LFQKKCPLPVREAADKEPIEKGTVYFAPPDYHLLVEQERIFSLSNEEPVLYSRPSIDVLFETAADAYREGLIGIVLTGANEDGARGLKAVIAAGGRGIVQRPEQAQSPTMPRAALAMNPAARPATLDEIVTFLKSIPS
jgi:two-component system chemotaxis response regulator CheB